MKIVKKYCLALLPDWYHSCPSKTFMILFAIWEWQLFGGGKPSNQHFQHLRRIGWMEVYAEEKWKGRGVIKVWRPISNYWLDSTSAQLILSTCPPSSPCKRSTFVNYWIYHCLFAFFSFCGWDKAMIHSSAFFGAGAVWELPDLFIPTKTKGSTLKRNSQSLNVQIKTM